LTFSVFPGNPKFLGTVAKLKLIYFISPVWHQQSPSFFLKIIITGWRIPVQIVVEIISMISTVVAIIMIIIIVTMR